MENNNRNSRIKTHHELLHSRDFQCCCCFHVRTGTIALGIIHVMMQMAVVAVIATAVINPDALASEPKSTVMEATVDVNEGRLEIHRDTFSQVTAIMRTSKQDLVTALLLSSLFGFISMLLVYGAFWGYAAYLVPFFAIMCCDFANAMLRLIGSFAENHSSRTSDAPLSGFCLMLVVILKAYLLNMVWSCYKFLRLRQELLRNPPVAMTGGQPSMGTRPATMEAGQLLPDYDAIQKFHYNFYPTPPPPYAAATRMPTLEQVVAPPPSYQDVAGTSRQPQPPAQLSELPPDVVIHGHTPESASSVEALDLACRCLDLEVQETVEAYEKQENLAKKNKETKDTSESGPSGINLKDQTDNNNK